MTAALLTAAQTLADAGIRTAHTLDAISSPVVALVDRAELERVAAARDLDVTVEPGDQGWTWMSFRLPGVVVRAGSRSSRALPDGAASDVDAAPPLRYGPSEVAPWR